MELEVARRPVARRRRWPIAALTAGALLVVAVGALWPEDSTREVTPPEDPGLAQGALSDPDTPAAPVPEGVAPAWEPPRTAASEPVRRSRAWPAQPVLVCRDVDDDRCQRVAEAVLELVRPAGGQPSAVVAPRVISVAVWRSLICGDSLDCPTARLAGASSLGSAVVRFAGSTGALWVNVIGEPVVDGSATDDDGAPTDDMATEAWPVRWTP